MVTHTLVYPTLTSIEMSSSAKCGSFSPKVNTIIVYRYIVQMNIICTQELHFNVSQHEQ